MSPTPALMVLVALALPLPVLVADHALAASSDKPTSYPHASSPQRSPHPSPVVVPIDVATLATLPRESVTATVHGATLHCEGVALLALLRAAGALPTEPLRGAPLASYVLVSARDGYRVVYALADLEPTLGNHRVLLVDRCEGQPLDDQDGPLRLIAPGESRATRWVRQVHAITVVSAP